MSVGKSVLTKNDIITLLRTQYNIEGNIEITKLNRGSSNLFEINVNGKRYILKEFNSNKPVSLVEKEIRLIKYLQNGKLQVPQYIQLNDGRYYFIFNGKVVILQQFIEGYTVENNTGNYEQMMESATILGKLIRELIGYEGLEEEGIIDKWFSKKSVQIGVQKLEEEKKNIKGDNKYKEQFIADFNDKILIANALIDQFDFGIIRRLSIMNTHGDYSIQQLIYNEGKLATVIDFETAKKMPIVWEIVRSYSYVDKNAEDGKIDTDNLIQYFKEVSKYVELNEYDLKFAPHIYLMQLIGSTFGYREYNKDCSQKDLLKFALFRTNLCRSLYANLDKISESLLENVPHRQMISYFNFWLLPGERVQKKEYRTLHKIKVLCKKE